jgi:GTP cyclohydrolase III
MGSEIFDAVHVCEESAIKAGSAQDRAREEEAEA